MNRFFVPATTAFVAVAASSFLGRNLIASAERREEDKFAVSTSLQRWSIPLSSRVCLCRSAEVKDRSTCNSVDDSVLGVSFRRSLSLPEKAWAGNCLYTCVAAVPRCMHDFCWLPASRAYSLGVFVDAERTSQWIEMTQRQRSVCTRPSDRSPFNKEEAAEASRRERNSQTGGAESVLLLPSKTKSLVSDDVAKRDTSLTEFSEDDIRVLLSAEVPKTLCFHFVGSKDKRHILKGFERSLHAAAKPHLMVSISLIKLKLLLFAKNKVCQRLSLGVTSDAAHPQPPEMHGRFSKDVAEFINAISSVDLCSGSRLYISLSEENTRAPHFNDEEKRRTHDRDASSAFLTDTALASALAAEMNRQNEEAHACLSSCRKVLVFFRHAAPTGGKETKTKMESETEAPLEEGGVFLCEINSPLLVSAFHALFFESPVGGKAHLESVAQAIRRRAAFELKRRAEEVRPNS